MKKIQETQITFIGAGNMAEALIVGLTKDGLCSADNLVVSDIRSERVKELVERFGVRGNADNKAAVQEAGVIVLAVKPQNCAEVLAELSGSCTDKIVLSIAAGITTSAIEDALGVWIKVIRAMPNTPALVGSGAAAICGGTWAKEEDLDLAEQLLQSVGIVVRVSEDKMDAVTALSGSGPAYVFKLIESMQQAAHTMELSEDVALDLILATVVGAAHLCRETGVSAAELRKRVTSKGGTTAAALQVLEQQKVLEVFVEAIQAAWKRSRELSLG